MVAKEVNGLLLKGQNWGWGGSSTKMAVAFAPNRNVGVLCSPRTVMVAVAA